MQSIKYLTKVGIPQRRADVLRRGRLVDFLHQSVDKRVILVCAPAGYGKTTLLADFAHDAGLPVCWYSLDAPDTDPRTFFEYLVLALRQRFPRFGKQTEALLSSLPDLSRDLNSVVASLVNEIQADIQDYFLLVLDDYQWIDDAEAINSAMDQLIYYLPDNCHLVFCSRTLPRLTFSRLAALRQVAGLGSGDLRFSQDEITRLLRDNYKLVLPPQEMEEIVRASEGWITGILLTTHTMWMGLVESLVKAKDAGSPLFDYLANEVYLQQTPQVQRFLLFSAVLDQLSPDLCDRLFSEGAARDMLQYLSRANLFIEALEGPGEWYRYHNLFQTFLRSKLKAEMPDVHAQMNLRAGQLAESDAEWDHAIAYYLEATAAEDAACMVERVGEDLIRSGRWQTLFQWINSLPAGIVEARPKLGEFRGRTYLWSGEIDRAIFHLRQASDRYRNVGDREAAGGALTLMSSGLRMKARYSEAVATCSEALELQNGQPNRVAAEAYRDTGICLASQGGLDEAAVQLGKALEIYEQLSDETGTAIISESLGIVAVRSGDLAKGMAFYRKALELWQRSGRIPPVAGVLNSIGMVHFYTGEYEQAQQFVEEALEIARQGGYYRGEAMVLGSLADIRRDSGNLREALESYEAALDLAHRVDEVQQGCYLLDGLANTHRMLGDYATAERLLRQAVQQAEEAHIQYDLTYLLVSQGILAEELGDLARAEKLLRSAVEKIASSGSKRDLARAHFHLAHSFFQAEKHKLAERHLEKSLELCRQLGYDQFMVSEGSRAANFLAWAISRGIGNRRLELVVDRLRHRGLDVDKGRQPRIRIEESRPTRVDAYALGQARVLVDSRLLTSSDWAVEKTKELFFYLLQQPESLRKEQVIDAIWPELDLGKSNSQFHSTMYRLRRATFPQCVAFKDGRYTLTLGKSAYYDVVQFLDCFEKAEGAGPGSTDRISNYQAAVDLYKGPYLDDFYADWVTTMREDLESKYVCALNELARLRAAGGAIDQAIQLLRTALATDPFKEEAHYGLVHYSALVGDRATALRHYRDYVDLLRDELDAEPGRAIAALAKLVASGQAIPPIRSSVR